MDEDEAADAMPEPPSADHSVTPEGAHQRTRLSAALARSGCGAHEAPTGADANSADGGWTGCARAEARPAAHRRSRSLGLGELPVLQSIALRATEHARRRGRASVAGSRPTDREALAKPGGSERADGSGARAVAAPWPLPRDASALSLIHI